MSGSKLNVVDLEIFVRSVSVARRSVTSLKVFRSQFRGKQKKPLPRSTKLLKIILGVFHSPRTGAGGVLLAIGEERRMAIFEKIFIRRKLNRIDRAKKYGIQ